MVKNSTLGRGEKLKLTLGEGFTIEKLIPWREVIVDFILTKIIAKLFICNFSFSIFNVHKISLTY